jgi:hypothetical protein
MSRAWGTLILAAIGTSLEIISYSLFMVVFGVVMGAISAFLFGKIAYSQKESANVKKFIHCSKQNGTT